ncbi:ADP-ribosylglycohydrolase [Dendrothele bispora CBS 962.96]|uniref:ADP-ribosylglycohydrolase n=1 Tax=Dendrothele bispora (strain CBS 962.96) TaxID=1314807 RepID=A0A4V4HFQ6_DENBC|nr:ADP-ribosylglycohydrolase [Dendrothele bispora CBS 962.96]
MTSTNLDLPDNTAIMDRVRGALIGSALGDTMGLYTEFLTPQMAKKYYPTQEFSLVEPVTKLYQDYHRARFEPRAWTDDTDHTLLIILSYLREGRLNPDDFAKRLRIWCEQGLLVLNRLPMGLGNTVGSVVLDPSYLSHPTQTAYEKWIKSGKQIAPNGSVMRTVPIGIICLNPAAAEGSDIEIHTFEQALKMGSVTHVDPRCGLSVVIVSALVRLLCLDQIRNEKDIDALLERAWTYVSHKYRFVAEENRDSCGDGSGSSSSLSSNPSERGDPLEGGGMNRKDFEKHVYAKTLDELKLADSRTIGYTYKCLGSGIWCLRQVLKRRETFKSAMIKLIMCGGDADTNGAVAGGLMGALVGWENLPEEWRDGMKHREWYNGKIDQLGVVLGLREGEGYERLEDRDTEMDGGKGMLGEEEIKKREMEVMERILLAEKKRAEDAEKEMNAAKKSTWYESISFRLS